MKSGRLVLLLLGILLISASAYVYLVESPRLLEVSPSPGAEAVLAKTPIQLVFSKGMQPESVTQRLAIQPEMPGEYAWEGDTLIFTPAEPWPRGETITVEIAPGARSATLIPLPLRSGRQWSFTVSRPLLAFLYPASGQADLYTIDPGFGEATRLTESNFGVLDFSVGFDGTKIYYSGPNATGGSDILQIKREQAGGWSFSPLLACPEAYCRSPQPSPDGRFLAFEREALPGSGRAQFPRVSILTLPEGNEEGSQPEEKLAGVPDHPTRLPSWSASGLLSFYDVAQKAFVVLDPVTGESTAFPNETGEAGAWSPDGNLFIAPEIFFLPAGGSGDDTLATSHLIAYNMKDGVGRDLSQGPVVEDASPALSPDGNQIAFARKFLDAARWTPGRQVWVMSAGGEDPNPLSDAPFYNHSAFAWSPDGEQLAYIRFNQEAPTQPPEIWLVNADGSGAQQLLTGGFSPRWIP